MKTINVNIPTGTDFAAATKAVRSSFAQQIQKLASAAEPKTDEQKLAVIEAKEKNRKNKIAAKIRRLKAQL